MDIYQQRKYRLGRAPFNEGLATTYDAWYVCLKCGETWNVTANYDGLSHDSGRCGGTIVFQGKEKEDRTKKRADELLKALKFMTRQVESHYNGNGFTHKSGVIVKHLSAAKSLICDCELGLSSAKADSRDMTVGWVDPRGPFPTSKSQK